MVSTQIQMVIDRHACDGTRLVQILRETQDALGWLSPQTITELASGLGLPRARVQSTATFYSFFHTRPLGQYRVLFSDNITDRMLGAPALMQTLCQMLQTQPGCVSKDGLVSIDTTSCTGLCDQGPAVLVNYRAIPRMNMNKIAAMADLIRRRIPIDEWPSDWFTIADNIHRRSILLENSFPAGAALTAALDRGAATTLLDIEQAGLRGRGGAGFSSSIKWRACLNAPGAEHYVVCNADEGEPGTFKDRVLLNTQFDLLIDGMCIAALITGARKGLIYLRGEYRYLLDTLQTRLLQRRSLNLLGHNILGRGLDFDIEIHLGAGAYICGEESALIESLEGKPGKPRIRPPYPVTQGYLGQPTAVNNVETLCLAALIAVRGGAWFDAIGTPVSAGTKVLSISGDVQRPGIYEYPYGVQIAQVLADCGARDTQMITTAGAAGNCLSANEFHRCIAFEDVPTGGSIMVFDHTRDPFDVARNFAHFFAHESCGFCTPCRVGTAVNARLIDKLDRGQGSPYDLEEMDRMHALMQGASHCGLGNTASLVLQDLRQKFGPAFARRLHSQSYEPAFDLDAALSQSRRITGRNDAEAHLSDNQSSLQAHHPASSHHE